MSTAGGGQRSKTRLVEGELRRRICAGTYQPGERLPTFDDMVAEFRVSRMVLQQAVGRLRGDGFVRTLHRRGLFVSEAPPHLYRVALLFADAPGGPGWPRMNLAIVNEARRLEHEHADWRFEVYDGLLDTHSSADRLAALEADVRAQRLAGVVFAPRTFEFCERPVLADSAVAKAFVCARDDSAYPAIVGVDSAALYRRAIERLVAKGRRRIAILHMAETTLGLDHAALYASAGLHLHRPWIQWIGRSHPQYAEQIVSLLLDYPAATRPDGLIVADDNLIEHAAAGIAATGLHVGAELDVVAHCNWPWPLPSVLPFERIGFDATDILRRSIEAVVTQRDGGTPRLQKVPPLFEWEVEPPGDVPSPLRF